MRWCCHAPGGLAGISCSRRGAVVTCRSARLCGLTSQRRRASLPFRAFELAPWACHADRSVTICFWANSGGLGCCAVALSGEVHDGRGTERLGHHRQGPARGPAVRRGGPRYGQGRGGQEPAQVGQQPGPLAGRSGKLAAFDELADVILAGGESMLVFTQYTQMATLLQQHLDGRGIRSLFLHGRVPVRRREEMVQQFQAGHAPVFLLSLKAGGTGLIGVKWDQCWTRSAPSLAAPQPCWTVTCRLRSPGMSRRLAWTCFPARARSGPAVPAPTTPTRASTRRRSATWSPTRSTRTRSPFCCCAAGPGAKCWPGCGAAVVAGPQSAAAP